MDNFDNIKGSLLFFFNFRHSSFFVKISFLFNQFFLLLETDLILETFLLWFFFRSNISWNYSILIQFLSSLFDLSQWTMLSENVSIFTEFPWFFFDLSYWFDQICSVQIKRCLLIYFFRSLGFSRLCKNIEFLLLYIPRAFSVMLVDWEVFLGISE